jgi:hypothetical protein
MSVSFWKKQYESAEWRRKLGWAKFYRSERDRHVENQQAIQSIRTLQEGIRDAEARGIPEFVQNELKDMMEILRKKIDCPVCLDEIDPQDISFGQCGHKFCSACLNRLKTEEPKKCAICRKKV